MTISPDDPYAGRSVIDLEAERRQLEEQYDQHASRGWTASLDAISSHLEKVCSEIAARGGSIL